MQVQDNNGDQMFHKCSQTAYHNTGVILQRIKKLTTPSPDLKMRGRLSSRGPCAINDADAKMRADGKISTISEKETHF